MRFQDKPYACGAAAVVNTLRALGRRVSEAQVRKYAGTSKKFGTQEGGIQQAIERFDLSYGEIKERSFVGAQEALLSFLQAGIPVILLTEAGQHWETAFGLLGARVLMFDSQNTKANRQEGGVHILTIGDSLRRYWVPAPGVPRYGIWVKERAP